MPASTSALNIVIFGAGSIGCYLGGQWLGAGCKVSFIGRERVRAEIAEHGLRLSDQDSWKLHLPPERIDYGTKPAALKNADIVALCVKSIGTEAAAREIARHGRKGATVISFQNGISNAETLKRLLPGFAVAHGMVPYNVIQPGPGRWHRATGGELMAERMAATETLAAAIGDGPGRLLLTDDVRSVAWGKLLLNLNNAINALSGRTLLEELGERDYRRVLAAAMLETLNLLNAAGIEPAKIGPLPPRLLPHAVGSPNFIFKNLFLRIQRIDPAARSSMWDDFVAERPTEIDYLNGEVVKLAETLGRDAPVNRAIGELVKERQFGIERAWGPKELKRHVFRAHGVTRFFGY